MDPEEERRLFFNRRTDKSIMSKRIVNEFSGARLRIISRVMDAEPGLQFGILNEDLVLKSTHGGRQEIKATFVESDKRIRTLVFQKFNSKTGPVEKFSFTFQPHEIAKLVEFLAGLKLLDVSNPEKRHVSDHELAEIILDRGQTNRLLAANQSLLMEIAENADLQRDFVALGYRRNQLKYFERLLTDDIFFASEKERCSGSPEDVWQKFFELNTWIFGYGLSYQFLTGLDKKKLEQAVSGFDLSGPGKVVDGVMKTRGIVKSLCFVEVKTHDTDLLSGDSRRSGVWHPSSKLTAAVAQIQVTVQSALEALQDIVTPKEKNGDPTGEQLFNVTPRSFLVVGNLSEFQAEHGTNVDKFKSFELYRRNLTAPEIITFDELFERARFIVSQSK